MVCQIVLVRLERISCCYTGQKTIETRLRKGFIQCTSFHFRLTRRMPFARVDGLTSFLISFNSESHTFVGAPHNDMEKASACNDFTDLHVFSSLGPFALHILYSASTTVPKRSTKADRPKMLGRGCLQIFIGIIIWFFGQNMSTFDSHQAQSKIESYWSKVRPLRLRL